LSFTGRKFRETGRNLGSDINKKKDKILLIYAYHRESGEIVAFVWEKRDLKTAKKLRI
jgi:IS1 family transposase